ncbi:substrate-binding periplasmic protein [Chitinimonas sp. BJB300]|uniref:substrate-binding periplasmic protein n=1 Tax=Chitinimonas sp. BJB300 TaxID=1559339 RepID=UPI0013046A6E|nr:transporter substrate-binding domain-containing protein [Chitinimonas sp. BJB300]
MKVLALACALAVAPAFAADTLTFTTEESPPFNMTVSGKVSGVATEAVEEMAKRAGVTIKISMLPWERAYDMAQKEANTCVYSTTRTPPREALFKWVGPLVANKWVLYAKADAKPVAKIEDVKAAKIGGYRGDAIANFLKDGGYKVEETTNDAQNPEKLVAGRIDYWATSEAVGGTLVKEKKITGIKVILTFKEAQMYLACGKGVADATIKQLNDALSAMTKDGTLEKMTKKYL